METPTNARCIEVEVGGHRVALCLAMNADRANEEYDGYYHNGSEYGDWTEVTDGTKKTIREQAAEATRHAWNNGPNVSERLKQVRTGISNLGSYWKGSGVSKTAPGAKQPVGGSTNAPSAQHVNGRTDNHNAESKGTGEEVHDGVVKATEDPKFEGKDANTQNLATEGSASSLGSSELSTDASASEPNGTIDAEPGRNAKSTTPVPNVDSNSNSKPKRKRKNSEDTSIYKMYIGDRMSSIRDHFAECKLGDMRALLTTTDKRIKVYRSDKVSSKKNGIPKVEHEKQPGVTGEMKCLWDHLNENVSTSQIRSNRYAMLTDTTTQKSIRLDMVSDYTLVYTDDKSNKIVLVDDDEEDDVEVKVAEVLVKQGSQSGYNRTVLYTDSCLRLADGVKLNGISNSKVKREVRILIFCLLIVTGWGFYTHANQTTEISFENGDNSTTDWTLSVKQGENHFTMFDTNTEFMFTDTGVSSVQAKPSKEGAAASLRDSSKSAKSASTGSLSSRNVGQIVTRAAKAQSPVSKQANVATHNMKLRSAKQNVESSKADEAPKAAKQAGETAKNKTGEASNKKAANNASDTSSSDDAIAHHTRSKTQNMSEQLAKKNNGNKSK